MVGGNFNFDIDQVIGFDDDNKILIHKDDKYHRVTINEEIKNKLEFNQVHEGIANIKLHLKDRLPVFFQWILIFYATINNALIPPWILSIPAEKYLRIAWRFFM